MFWGINLKPNRKYTQTASKNFHISQAGLDCEGATKDVSNKIYITVEESQKILICTLRKNVCEQAMLNLYFAKGDKICLQNIGNGNVSLSGYLTVDSMFGDEEEEESDAEDLNEISNGKLLKNKKKKSKATEEEEDDENEDEMEDAMLKAALEMDDDEEDDDDDEEGADDQEDDEDDDEEEEEEDDDDDNEIVEPKKKVSKLEKKEVKPQQQNGIAALEMDDDEEDDDAEEEADDQEDDDDDEDDDEEEEEENDDDDNEIEEPKMKVAKLEKKEVKPQQQNGIAGNAQKSKKEKMAEKQQQQKPAAGGKRTITGGVKIEDIRVGNGPEAKTGKRAQVYYMGRLKSNNKTFDSLRNGTPFKFGVGRDEVIKGLDVGVVGMKVGGKRRIICPPLMAYGARGSPPIIPPNSTLIFDVELKGVN